VKSFARFAAWTIAALAGALIAYELSFLARVWWWKDHNPQGTAFMEAQLERLREKKPEAKLKHQWVPYEKISGNLKRAVVAAEDAKFVDHEGFDWEAIEKAMEKNKQKGKVVRGGSTISQQLAKNLFLSGHRTVLRKGQEALITVMIERLWDKRRILEVYLNVAEFGPGVFGVGAASARYFAISPARLGRDEAARLAAVLPAPRILHADRPSAYVRSRTARIAQEMARLGGPGYLRSM
jgi:monofunctional biosynthetic peptidoglycan transglycosylase